MAEPQTSTSAVLDYQAYPHIFETVFAAAPAASLFVLRLTCKALRDRVDEVLAADLTIQYDYTRRLIVVRSSRDWQPRFPTRVLPRHTQPGEWPTSAVTLFSRTLKHTALVDMSEPFPPNGLDPLPVFLQNVQVARIAVHQDMFTDMQRPPDLSGPVIAPEYVLLGPVEHNRSMPGLRIPAWVDRVVINSPVHSPTVILENIGRPAMLREMVFILNARFGLDKSIPDFELRQEHQALAKSVQSILTAGQSFLNVFVVGIETLSPLTLGIATAELDGRSVTETFRSRVRSGVIFHFGEDNIDDRMERVHFLTLEEYSRRRTPEQISFEMGEPL